MDTFNFIGKISAIKDSEKFHPVETTTLTTGLMITKVRFHCISGTNRIMCTAQGMRWKDENKNNAIKTWSKSEGDKKGEAIEIPWAKRFDKDQIDKVAGFKKFVFDSGDSKMRYALQDAVKAFKNGKITDELMEKTGCDTLEKAELALKKSLNKRREFLSEYDFAETMVQVVQSDKIKDKLFHISGYYDVQYSQDKKRYYTNYHVTQVYLAKENEAPSTEARMNVFFGEGSFDDLMFGETGKADLNGWVMYWDKNVKSNGFAPISIAIRENEEVLEFLKEDVFSSKDNEIKQVGLVLNVIDGAERKEITMDDLTDKQRRLIKFGALDFEDLKAKLGGNTYGDRISELRYVKLNVNGSDVEDTVYTLDDMHEAREKVTEVDPDDVLPFDVDDEEDDLI